MSGFLFNEIIFGPLKSRRLGISLGINLLPTNHKVCNYNCVYCECGWNQELNAEDIKLPGRTEIKNALQDRLIQLKNENMPLDSITFAGNGEPTMHPEFAGIVRDTLALRDQYMPGVKVAVLSNASMIGDPKVFAALMKLDYNIQKLDAGFQGLFELINNPVLPINFSGMIRDLRKFNEKVIIQSLFLRGNYKGDIVDNTTETEVGEWLNHLSVIRPSMVMIYPISRATQIQNLEKIGTFELEIIAEKVRKLGIEAKVYN